MARIKIEFPSVFTFSTQLPVRISDINYGGHLGNDAVLSMLHEARLRFLQHYGYSELELAGKSLIIADVAIEYKGEGFHGDLLTIQVVAHDFNKYGFDVVYQITNQENRLISLAKTGMICFDYNTRKVSSLPAEVQMKLSSV